MKAASLIGAKSLKEALASSRSIRVIDATYFLANSPFCGPEGSTPLAEYNKAHIPSARFVDIDAFSEASFSAAPHNLPDPQTFLRLMAELSITPDTEVVAYDQHGMFSAPRMWYTMRSYGHPARVAVLDGGLPAWQECGFDVASNDNAPATDVGLTDFEWVKDQKMQWDFTQMQQWSTASADEKQNTQVLDARAAGRFTGDAPEPREGMRGGHIPGSKSSSSSSSSSGISSSGSSSGSSSSSTSVGGLPHRKL